MNRTEYSRITGTGSYLPGAPVSNAELIQKHGLESSDEWIVERTGIKQRHMAADHENAVTFAEQAARQALEAAGSRVGSRLR